MCDKRSSDAIKLLLAYEKYPCLWDKTDADYKDRYKRDLAEVEILNILGLEESDVKLLRKKIRSLRCTYNQEMAKIRMSKKSGASGADVYKPKLSWFHIADSFLKKTHEGRLRECDVTTNEAVRREPTLVFLTPKKESATSEDEDSAAYFQPSSPQPITSMPILSCQTFSLADNVPSTSTQDFSDIKLKDTSEEVVIYNNSRRKRQRDEDDSSDDVFNNAQQFSSKQSNVLNEFETFAQHVAVQLQQLPLDVAVELQNDIQNLITCRRLNVIRNHPSYVPR